jgi:hypothetical protein
MNEMQASVHANACTNRLHIAYSKGLAGDAILILISNTGGLKY